MKTLGIKIKKIISIILVVATLMTVCFPVIAEAGSYGSYYFTQYYSSNKSSSGTAKFVFKEKRSGEVNFSAEGFKLAIKKTKNFLGGDIDFGLSSHLMYFSISGSYMYFSDSEATANKNNARIRAKVKIKDDKNYGVFNSPKDIVKIDTFQARKLEYLADFWNNNWGDAEIATRVYFKKNSKQANNTSSGSSSSGSSYGKVTRLSYSNNGYGSSQYTGFSSYSNNSSNMYLEDDYCTASTYVKSYNPGRYHVQVSALNLRTGAGTRNSIITSLPYGTQINITQVSNGWGYGFVNGMYGWVSLYYCSYEGPCITVPAAPTVRLNTSTKIPVGGLMTVAWDAVYDAQYYTCTFYNSSGAEVKSYSNIYTTSCSFSPDTAGTYTAKVTAHNSLYTGPQSAASPSVTALASNKVTYLNDDNTLIAEQKVPYGENATAPLAPSKKGCTFQGWDGNLNNVTEDREIKAKYTVNQYTVQFIDYQDKIIDTQQITFGEDATPPEVNDAPKNKIFVGWNSINYQNVYSVDKNEPIKIYAVYGTKNKDLPIVSEITQAYRQPDGYYVYFNLENTVDEIRRGRAIIALKTSKGKLIDMTESAAFSIPANGKKENMEVFLPSDTAASVAELIIVDSYSSGIPISPIVSSSIENGRMWSKWYELEEWNKIKDTLGSDAQIETRKEYRYREKEFSKGNTKTKEGWTYIDGSRVASVGNWSGWQDTVVEAFEYEDRKREIDKRQVDVFAYNSYYRYYHYYNYYGGYSNGNYHILEAYDHLGKGGYTEHVITPGYALAANGTSDCTGVARFKGYKCSQCGYSDYWYGGLHTDKYKSGEKTQYRYLDTTYTYSFFRFKPWNEWIAEPITPTDKIEVDERDVYRYQSTSALLEDTTGEVVPLKGNLGTAYANKNVTLFISKHNAYSDFTNEYVGQTTTDANGNYEFNYVLREQPTAETGDFTISIGVEGMTEPMHIDVIPAPIPKYTVKYLDIDGNVINTQTVTKGDNAVIPENAPEVPGKTFVCWNNSGTNVQSNLEISPVYIDNEYTIVYIDYRANTYEVQKYKYGEPLMAPAFDDCESGYAKGWDAAIDGTVSVTSDMVLTAVYETKTYTVNFHDKDGNIIDSQTIDYDGAAEAPELPEEEGVEYYDWNIIADELMSIKGDLAVYPVYEFEETTANPVTSVISGSYGTSQTVELTCETEDALIFYTLDGTSPRDNPDAILYKDPFTIDETTTLNFYATSMNRNDSEICEEHYIIGGKGHLVTVNSTMEDGYNYTFIVDSMSDISLTQFDDEYGYTPEGLYYDADCTQEANLSRDTFANIVTLYCKYTINSYDVTFCDTDGSVIKTESVVFGEEATPPEMTDRGTLNFIGWYGGDFGCVTEDVEVTAIYMEESEIVHVEFDRENYTMDEGDTLQVNATITPEEKIDTVLVWISSDPSVAIVDEAGLVTAVGEGKATIYAITEDDMASDSIDITVGASPNYSICLKDLSVLNFDSLGYLRRIPIDGTTNTVAFVKSQLKNNPANLTFISHSGDVLSDSSLVGTGTKIILKNGVEVIDAKIAIMTGDITCDGKINNKDVAYAARLLVKKQTAEEYQLLAMDVNGDGKVNNRDVAMVARYLVGKNQLTA